MKKKHNEGFTLVELLVSIVILAAIVLPTCTSLVLSYRMNAKTKALTQAQLAVSSAVETLMAKGITDDYLTSLDDFTYIVDFETMRESYTCTSEQFPGLLFELSQKEGEPYFSVTVKDIEGQVEVTTYIRDNTKNVTLKEVANHEET